MDHTTEVTVFINSHKDQLLASGVPEHFWKHLHTKLANRIFDASGFFHILKCMRSDEEEDDIQSKLILHASTKINKLDPKQIYLIDHAWTYRIKDAKSLLFVHDGLRERLCDVFDIDTTKDTHEVVEIIFNCTWKINNFYYIHDNPNAFSCEPTWYVMDELGIAVTHSNHPNCRIVPFIYFNDQITYSLLFPIEDIFEGDMICRDFAEGVTDMKRREAILLPWVPKIFNDDINPAEPPEEYFLGGHVKESLPNLSKLENKVVKKSVLNVFSQYSLVKTNLNRSMFCIVDDEDEADILWYTEHFRDFDKLSETPEKYVNQFPFEYVITVKDLLCIICRENSNASWLPLSYNLITELPNFISYFQRREEDGKDNYWIVKPFNLARGLDIHITNNLDHILKVSLTCPKIVQKYITNPVLFYRPECDGNVKFDIRYVLLLESVKPLKAYVYKNFFLRFANKTFSLSNFHDYQKHFTVMNYSDEVNLKHMKCVDFLLSWIVQYPDYDWRDIEDSIFRMLKEVLECAVRKDPPCGIAHSPQSRALYAADIMLEWTREDEIQPKILEINFTPDCQRACDYYPEFFNDIFGVLFLNENSDRVIPL